MAASAAAALDAESLAKIRALLAAETSEGLSLGLALLESLGATAADLDAALAPPVGAVVAAVADGWLQAGEPGRAGFDRFHRLVVAPRFFAERDADRLAGRPFLDLVEIPAGEFELGRSTMSLLKNPSTACGSRGRFASGRPRSPRGSGGW